MRAIGEGRTVGALGVFLTLSLFASAAAAETAPDLFSIGLGGFDVVKFHASNHTRRERSLDLRLEYRFGRSLLPSLEPYVQVHPWVGLETNNDGMLYGGGGILMDVPVGPFVVTPSFGAGLWQRGESKKLGSPIEFRTTLEVGYRFDGGMRLSGFLSHMSNAGITNRNPGADSVGMYLHIPTAGFFGNR